MADQLSIDLWFFGLDAPAGGLAGWERLLDAGEQARQARFKFAHDQKRFLICRMRMRRILGRYVRADPATLVFGEVGRGKPVLGGVHAGAALAFNLSHTDGLACLAVVRSGRHTLGVDIERVRAIDDEFAAFALTPREVARVRRASRGAAFDRAFFHHWTAKEAFLKGPGHGLWQSLRTFDVAPEPDGPACARDGAIAFHEAGLPRIDDPGQRAAGWRLFTFEVGREFIGAVAVDAGAACDIRFRARHLAPESLPVRPR